MSVRNNWHGLHRQHVTSHMGCHFTTLTCHQILLFKATFRTTPLLCQWEALLGSHNQSTFPAQLRLQIITNDKFLLFWLFIIKRHTWIKIFFQSTIYLKFLCSCPIISPRSISIQHILGDSVKRAFGHMLGLCNKSIVITVLSNITNLHCILVQRSLNFALYYVTIKYCALSKLP